jgi:hypothetical protein
LKKSEKPLDKRKEMWYNRKACKQIERYSKQADLKNHASRNFKKSLKKGLTKTRKCGIMNKSLDEVTTSKNDKICILKTEQCEKRKGKKKLEPLLILIQKNQFEKSDKTIKRKQ